MQPKQGTAEPKQRRDTGTAGPLVRTGKGGSRCRQNVAARRQVEEEDREDEEEPVPIPSDDLPHRRGGPFTHDALARQNRHRGRVRADGLFAVSA